jgi:hypothetical protein
MTPCGLVGGYQCFEGTCNFLIFILEMVVSGPYETFVTTYETESWHKPDEYDLNVLGREIVKCHVIEWP